jgi:Family of unknown function (DUF5343)
VPLADSYVFIYGQLKDVFKRLSEGQAPDKFTRQHLKDLGFTSSSFHAVIPLLKTLGFLAADGTPTARYHDYRNHAQSRSVMGQAVRQAYGDLFTIKANPTEADHALIEGKFKSTHNVSEPVAKHMANTFFALLSLADITAPVAKPPPAPKVESKPEPSPPSESKELPPPSHRPTLHYNIQIHLPATKDVEVFNAIFKSLREHLLD